MESWRDRVHLAAACGLGAVALLAWQPVQPGDTWLYAATGRWIVDHHAIPRVDPFSWTFVGRPWQSNGWLWGLLLWGVWSAGRFAAVAALKPLFVVATGLAIRWAAKVFGAAERPALLAMVIGPLLITPWIAERPQLATYLLLPVSLALARRSFGDDGLRVRWATGLVLVTLVWANLHTAALAAVPLVAAVGGGVALGRGRRAAVLADLGRTAVLSLAVAAATLANPWGVGIWTHASYVRRVSLGVVSEWVRPWHAGASGWLLLAAMAAVVVVAVWGRIWRHLDVALPLAVTMAFTLDAVRNGPLFLLVAAVALPVVAPATSARSADREQLVVVGGLAALLIAAVLSVPAIARTRDPRDTTPVGPVAAIPAGCRLANDYRLGNWVVFTRPDVPVSIDGRNDLYGHDLGQIGWFEHPDATTLAQLDGAGIDCVLATPDSPLPALLVRHGWSRAAADGNAVLVVRG